MKREPNDPGRRGSPASFFLVLALALTLGGLAFALYLDAPLVVAYLGGITLATFLLYGTDKVLSRSGGTRIPEFVLHLTTLLGGTLGALLGQLLFRHKTVKKPFRTTVILIVLLQAALLGAWVACWVVQPPWFPESLRFLIREAPLS